MWQWGKREQKRQRKVGGQKINHNYEDCPWTELKCKDVTKLKKLCVPELNKDLKHHGLKQHLKSSKSEKVKAIVRHSCLLQKSPVRSRAGQPTMRNARRLTQNEQGKSWQQWNRWKRRWSVWQWCQGRRWLNLCHSYIHQFRWGRCEWQAKCHTLRASHN